MNKQVNLGIVGGRRGAAFNKALKILEDKVRLVAICDISKEVLSAWQRERPEIKIFDDFDELLRKGDCDAVYLATPFKLHAKQAIKAMEAGVHVLSEVIAATTLDECWKLVDSVKSTGMKYMLAENCCYLRSNMMILNMVEKGVFGELTYAEGAYIHDCRNLFFDDHGHLTWRGSLLREHSGNFYPTHSLEPVAQWLGVNKPNGDRLITTSSFMTKEAAMHRFVEKKFGADHPGAKRSFYLHGDSTTTIICTEKGVVIVLRMDPISPRPHNMTHYVLQGTSASYISARHVNEDPLIWIEGKSPGTSPSLTLQQEAKWEPLWVYSDLYEHIRWKEKGDLARDFGHRGSDFFVIEDFIDSIIYDRQPPINVYDAVTWSSIMPLSIESMRKNGAPIEIPDFTK